MNVCVFLQFLLSFLQLMENLFFCYAGAFFYQAKGHAVFIKVYRRFKFALCKTFS